MGQLDLHPSPAWAKIHFGLAASAAMFYTQPQMILLNIKYDNTM